MPPTPSDTSKPVTSYVVVLDAAQIEALGDWCEAHGWQFYAPPYAHYGYKSDGIGLVAYQSGKLSIQGKKTQAFVTEVLEPQITKKFRLGFERVEHPEWFVEHAGMDESGKGDLFGPLVVACVIAGNSAVDYWLKNGLKESKAVNRDAALFKMEALVRKPEDVVIETAYTSMEKYNELYSKFKNLNELLAWLHSRALIKALERSPVTYGLLDQFSKAKLVHKYLTHQQNFKLDQRVRAEEDPVVAAASIIARAEYVRRLKKLSELSGIDLPKGCGPQAKKALTLFIEKHGTEALNQYTKLHFKTVTEVCDN